MKKQTDPVEPDQSGDKVKDAPKTPTPKKAIVPMQDASGDELRKEIRSLRDENKSRRLTQEELETKMSALDTRFADLETTNAQAKSELEQAQFRALALEAGVAAGLIQFLNASSFDLTDPDKTLDELRGLPAGGKNLPSAGKKVAPKKEKKLTVEDIGKMSDEEFEERKEEIVALQRDASYR